MVVLPADQHDIGVAAHHAGGQLGFLALGEAGGYREPETAAETLDGLIRAMRGRLGRVAVGG